MYQQPLIKCSRLFSQNSQFRQSASAILRSLGTSAPLHRADQHTSTVDENEVEKFNLLSQQWWNERGEFAALHSLNKLRVPLIRDALLRFSVEENAAEPLKELKIADIGCGGGLLSEPLARLGAHVTGVDAGRDNIAIAEAHSMLDESVSSRLRYLCTTVEMLASEEAGLYDGVVASEIIEHVNNQSEFVNACCRLTKPGGSIFFTTINKTRLSYALAIVAAEKLFRVVPAGSHDWGKFISPDDLELILSKNNFTTRLVHGMTLNPLTNRWYWIKDTCVNYVIHAVKSSTSENSATSSSSSSEDDT